MMIYGIFVWCCGSVYVLLTSRFDDERVVDDFIYFGNVKLLLFVVLF